ncbi:hypothetical protein LZK98_05525 [Sphingomonas cannabina]|uniref:hypothetical protein n=1 Tax=Sphingomonas cannabina TaxID=2899123 RepID=UPI001F27DDE0|nr:hypothetical protein [Sphingomonas cannabina]UIJ46406.1 hypothetical protein LZK98_05525 [Sphingomonas cannabina]
MRNLFKKATLGLALGATALVATAAPAEAQRWRGGWGRGYYHHHHDRTGPAIAAGVLGLAVGAAIASGSRDRYYDRPYYYDRGYYPRPYYYEDDYYYRYRPRCYTEWRYDPYWGDRERIRICR